MNDPLARYYSPETIERLERFVSLQEPRHQAFPLSLLRLAALAVATIGDQAVTNQMEGPEDQAPFAFGLDQAGKALMMLIQSLMPVRSSLAEDLLYTIEARIYGLTDDYWQRRERIRIQGKEGLLVCVSAQLARRRAGQ